MSNTWNGLDLDRLGWSRWGCWVGGGKCLQSSSVYCMYVYFLVTLSVLTMSAQISAGDLNVVICHDILVDSGCFDQKDWATLLWVGLSMRSAVSLCKQPSLVFTLGLVTRWLTFTLLPFNLFDDKINVGTHTSGSCLCSDTNIDLDFICRISLATKWTLICPQHLCRIGRRNTRIFLLLRSTTVLLLLVKC